MMTNQYSVSASAIDNNVAPSYGTALTQTKTNRSDEIPTLSLRAGLKRYREDRFGLLAELGDQRIDIAESSLGPMRLVFVTEAELARQLLVDHNDSLRKGPAIRRHGRPLFGNALLSASAADHRAQRKVLAPKFTPRLVSRFTQRMIDLIRGMLASWRQNRPTDFDTEITDLTLNIAASTMFGSHVPRASVEQLGAGLIASNRWVIERSTAIFRSPQWLPTPRNRSMQRALGAMEGVVYRMISEHRANNVKGDVLSALLEARDENGAGMSDKMIRDQVITFFIAGHETVATTLGWAYRMLCERPEIADRIAAEADQVFGDDADVTDAGAGAPALPDVRKLVFTRATLQEVMRIWPAAYMIGRQATEDVKLGNYRIRAGSYLVINPLGIHRRSDYFPDPLRFRSERFLHEPTWPRTAYQPFGAGPRVCIGSHFALLEATLVLALLCREMRFSDPSHPAPHGRRHDDQIADKYETEPLITLRPKHTVPFIPTWRTK